MEVNEDKKLISPASGATLVLKENGMYLDPYSNTLWSMDQLKDPRLQISPNTGAHLEPLGNGLYYDIYTRQTWSKEQLINKSLQTSPTTGAHLEPKENDTYYDKYANKTWTKEELSKEENTYNMSIVDTELKEANKQKELIKDKIKDIKGGLGDTMSIETGLMLGFEFHYITQRVEMLSKLKANPKEEIDYFNEYMAANANIITPLSKVATDPRKAARASMVLSEWKASIEDGYKSNKTNIMDINNKKNAVNIEFGEDVTDNIGLYVFSDKKENIRLIANARVRMEEEQLIKKIQNKDINIKM